MKGKFIDRPNTAVFTTRFILEKAESIKYVFHYEDDGAWEFIGSKESDESDYRVISLEEIIMIDNSILDISDLPLGYFAYRDTQKDKWTIEQII
jgi:hypothetical protein